MSDDLTKIAGAVVAVPLSHVELHMINEALRFVSTIPSFLMPATLYAAAVLASYADPELSAYNEKMQKAHDEMMATDGPDYEQMLAEKFSELTGSQTPAATATDAIEAALVEGKVDPSAS